MSLALTWDQLDRASKHEESGGQSTPISPYRPEDKYQFRLPTVADPRHFVSDLRNVEKDQYMQFRKGTTTLAFRFQGGVIMACDSRASQGSYLAVDCVRKIIEINEFLLGSMAGTAADCQYWERYLGKLCRMYELRNGERISVVHAARLLSNIFYNFRGYGLSAGCMLAGYDVSKQRAELFAIEDDGTRKKGDVFSVGSGSPYCYGVLDTGYRYDLTVDEAVELARRAIFHAGVRDAASGNYVRVYHVHDQGWTKRIEGDDFKQLQETVYPIYPTNQ